MPCACAMEASSGCVIKPATVAASAPAPAASSGYFVQQAFVTTGETRGDQVAILKGLKEGQTVVTSGQVKLKNGTWITVDNTIVPANSANPTPQEH